VTTAGRVDATLNSLRTTTTMPVNDIAVGLGLGVPSADGTSCVVSVSAIVTPSLTAHLTTQAPAGANCAQISDVGNLVVPLTFVVRVAHATPEPRQRIPGPSSSDRSRTSSPASSIQVASAHTRSRPVRPARSPSR
jgi:hypothetical protein